MLGGRKTGSHRSLHSILNRTAPPWLTVVMPCYRGETWIDSSLRSLAAGAAEGVDVLLIDSSPTSTTRDIAQSYSSSLRLRIVERSDLSSWQSKTNFGVSIAESEHVCWLGVDDLWLPGRAESVRTWIAAAPHAALHLGPGAIIDRNGRNLGVWRCPLPADRELQPAFVAERLLIQNFISAPAPVFRRDAWLSLGGLDQSLWYTADWDMWLKLAESGPVYYHDAVTIGFRIHDGSLTVTGSRDAADFAGQMQIVLDRHLAKRGRGADSIERVARASIRVNCALATGNIRALVKAACEVLCLGPAGVRRYLRDSRIMERAMPRLRAKLSGRL